MDKINSAGIGEKIIEFWDEGYGGDRIAVLTGDIVTGRSVIRYLNRQGIETTKTKKAVRCLNCGKEFLKVRNCFRRSKKHFCCMPCYWEHLKNPEYIRSVYGMRMARRAIRETGYHFSPDEVVHHIDYDTTNNDLNNLMVFKDQGDHNRWHKGGGRQRGVIPVWPPGYKDERDDDTKARDTLINEEAKVYSKRTGAAVFFNPQPKK